MFSEWMAAPTASPRERANALQRVAQGFVNAHRVQLDVTGGFPSGPAIIISNHLGYVDPVVICSLVPCSPIAKLEVAGWPLLGQIGQRYSVNFVVRSDPYHGAVGLFRALRTVEAGTSVLNFPEVTTAQGQILPFKRGIFGIAALANADGCSAAR